jgi:thioredoxin-like negative regulator of GroEL
MLEEINCDIPIEVIDIDKSIEISMEFGIRSVPTLVMMEENIQMKRMTGLKRKSDLETWLKT